MKLRQGISMAFALACVFGLVAMLAALTPVFAADKGGSGKIAAAEQPEWVPAWSGIYVGVNAGYQVSKGELDLNTPPAGTIINIDGLGGDGKIYGIHGGVDWRFKGTPILLGVMASYQRGESEFDINVPPLGALSNVLHASVEPTWKAGVRLGYVTAGNQMIYVGYQHARADLTISSSFMAKDINRDLSGHNYLVGVEIPLAQYVTFALQYDWTQYDSVNLLPATAAPTRLDLDTDVHAVTGRLNIKLPAFN